MSTTAKIRLATEADAESIQAIYAPYVSDTPISFELEPPSVAEIRDRMRKVLPRWPWLVCEKDGRILGYAYAGEHHSRAAYRWSVDTAVYIAANSHRAGVGRALYSVLLPILKLQNLRTAYAGITLPNPGSVGIHEAMGFRPLAVYPNVGHKMGAWRDVGWWHLDLNPGLGEPSEPLKPSGVQHNAAWSEIFARGEALLRV